MTSTAEVDVLRAAARSLARDSELEPALLGILQPLADRFGIASAAVFVVSSAGGALEIVAALGLGDRAALADAVRNPVHPVARTAKERAAGFDVRPMAAGGPALRSHLPLITGADGGGVVVGVLALAHDAPTNDDTRAFLANRLGSRSRRRRSVADGLRRSLKPSAGDDRRGGPPGDGGRVTEAVPQWGPPR